MLDIVEHGRTKDGNKLTLTIDSQNNAYYVTCEKSGYSDVILHCETSDEAKLLFSALKTVAKTEIGDSW